MIGPWRAGHRVALLENGEGFFPRAFEAIAGAERSVYLETFIWADDTVGQQLAQALIAAARRGVRVAVLADGFGSDGLDDAFLAPLGEAGVRVHFYDPRPRWWAPRTNVFRRMHRKILIVDEQLAFLGGINFCADHLLEGGKQSLHDYALEVEGPVVADIVAFADQSSTAPTPWWRRRRTRSGQNPQRACRTSPHTGSAQVRFLARDNHRYRDSIERAYLRMLHDAREYVIIANAYFFPSVRLLRAMKRAARRGVKVRLIVQGKPDMPIVRVAARWLYNDLVPAGVCIHEFCQRPLHAKVAVADGHWVTVGSSNLDPLSLSLNLEANVLVHDTALAQELRERLMVLVDQQCRAVEAATLPASTWWRRWGQGVVFHVLRHFPRWAGAVPSPRPYIDTRVGPASEAVSEDVTDHEDRHPLS